MNGGKETDFKRRRKKSCLRQGLSGFSNIKVVDTLVFASQGIFKT